MIFHGIHEFSEFFMLNRFWSILALKKCWANWPNALGNRVKGEFTKILITEVPCRNQGLLIEIMSRHF